MGSRPEQVNYSDVSNVKIHAGLLSFDYTDGCRFTEGEDPHHASYPMSVIKYMRIMVSSAGVPEELS